MGNLPRRRGPGGRRRTGFSQMSCYLLWSKPRGFFGPGWPELVTEGQMGICFALGVTRIWALFSILCNSSPISPDFVSSFTFYLTLMVGLGYGIVWGLEQNEVFTSSACFSSTEGFSINSAVLNIRVFLSISSPSSFFSFRPRTVPLLIHTAGESKIRLCFFPQTPPLPLTLIFISIIILAACLP